MFKAIFLPLPEIVGHSRPCLYIGTVPESEPLRVLNQHFVFEINADLTNLSNRQRYQLLTQLDAGNLPFILLNKPNNDGVFMLTGFLGRPYTQGNGAPIVLSSNGKKVVQHPINGAMTATVDVNGKRQAFNSTGGMWVPVEYNDDGSYNGILSKDNGGIGKLRDSKGRAILDSGHGFDKNTPFIGLPTADFRPGGNVYGKDDTVIGTLQDLDGDGSLQWVFNDTLKAMFPNWKHNSELFTEERGMTLENFRSDDPHQMTGKELQAAIRTLELDDDVERGFSGMLGPSDIATGEKSDYRIDTEEEFIARQKALYTGESPRKAPTPAPDQIEYLQGVRAKYAEVAVKSSTYSSVELSSTQQARLENNPIIQILHESEESTEETLLRSLKELLFTDPFFGIRIVPQGEHDVVQKPRGFNSVWLEIDGKVLKFLYPLAPSEFHKQIWHPENQLSKLAYLEGNSGFVAIRHHLDRFKWKSLYVGDFIAPHYRPYQKAGLIYCYIADKERGIRYPALAIPNDVLVPHKGMAYDDHLINQSDADLVFEAGYDGDTYGHYFPKDGNFCRIVAQEFLDVIKNRELLDRHASAEKCEEIAKWFFRHLQSAVCLRFESPVSIPNAVACGPVYFDDDGILQSQDWSRVDGQDLRLGRIVLPLLSTEELGLMDYLDADEFQMFGFDPPQECKDASVVGHFAEFSISVERSSDFDFQMENSVPHIKPIDAALEFLEAHPELKNPGVIV